MRGKGQESQRLHTGMSPKEWRPLRIPQTGYTHRPATSTDWLHPGARGNTRAGTASLAGITLAAKRLRGRSGYYPHSSFSKRSSVTSLEMVPTLPTSISL